MQADDDVKLAYTRLYYETSIFYVCAKNKHEWRVD